MADKHLTENLKGNYFSSERKDMTFLKGITLVALLPIWAGYAFALYNGDSNNLSNYSLLILAFSAMNFNAICGVEKIENKCVLYYKCLEMDKKFQNIVERRKKYGLCFRNKRIRKKD